MPEYLFDVDETAKRLGGVSRWSIYCWKNQGRLKATKVGDANDVPRIGCSRLLAPLQRSRGPDRCPQPREPHSRHASQSRDPEDKAADPLTARTTSAMTRLLPPHGFARLCGLITLQDETMTKVQLARIDFDYCTVDGEDRGFIKQRALLIHDMARKTGEAIRRSGSGSRK